MGHESRDAGGHERSDVDVSRSYWIVLGSALFLAVVMVAMWLMFRWREGRLAWEDQPLPVVTDRQAGEDRLPPEPGLLGSRITYELPRQSARSPSIVEDGNECFALGR